MAKKHLNITVVVNRVGPYHEARLNACSRLFNVSCVEVYGQEGTYGWAPSKHKRAFATYTLFENDLVHAKHNQFCRALFAILDKISPDVIALPGWSAKESLAGLRWALVNRVPSVIMSDSQSIDKERYRLAESFKKRIVRFFHTGLVAGTNHQKYLNSLGMPMAAISQGYDVVDNDFFAESSEWARKNRRSISSKYGLPENYFLTVSRFVSKKNIKGLLDSYLSYHLSSKEKKLPLVIVGDGPEKESLERFVDSHNLNDKVLFAGFRQIDELPHFYGLASCFLLASKEEQWGLVVNEAMASGLPVLISDRCGCSRELVRHGVNGFTFNPEEGFSGLLEKMSSATCDLEAMGVASREIISKWSPELFAGSLLKASSLAASLPEKRISFLDKLFLNVMMNR